MSVSSYMLCEYISVGTMFWFPYMVGKLCPGRTWASHEDLLGMVGFAAALSIQIRMICGLLVRKNNQVEYCGSGREAVCR